MAEFCLECAKEFLGFSDSEIRRAILSDTPEYCEGCGEFKPIVVVVKPVLRERMWRWLRDRLSNTN